MEPALIDRATLLLSATAKLAFGRASSRSVFKGIGPRSWWTDNKHKEDFEMRQLFVALSVMIAASPVRYSPTVPALPLRGICLILAVLTLLFVTLGSVGNKQSLPAPCTPVGSECLD
jgi:hypothetical protein